ncbi:MAG: hypothetical protein VZR53_08945 [Prevotella sp.]|nr:hypothetical protein [Prevotella sp.]
MRELDNTLLTIKNNNYKQNKEKTMNNLPKLVLALFALSSVLDIAEKIKNWGRDKKKDEKKQDEPSSQV